MPECGGLSVCYTCPSDLTLYTIGIATHPQAAQVGLQLPEAGHRKVMNPAFSTSHLRAFIPLLQRATSKVLSPYSALPSKSRFYTFAD